MSLLFILTPAHLMRTMSQIGLLEEHIAPEGEAEGGYSLTLMGTFLSKTHPLNSVRHKLLTWWVCSNTFCCQV
jgi:hypothetical protein